MHDRQRQALDNLTDALAAFGVEGVPDPDMSPSETIYHLAGAVAQSLASLITTVIDTNTSRTHSEAAFAASWVSLAREAGDEPGDQYASLGVLLSCLSAVPAHIETAPNRTADAAAHALTAAAALTALSPPDLPGPVAANIRTQANQAITKLGRTWRHGGRS